MLHPSCVELLPCHSYLQHAWSKNARSTLLLTDGTAVIIVAPPQDASSSEINCEVLSLKSDARLLLVLFGTFIHHNLPFGLSIDFPTRSGSGVGGILPDGCLPNPQTPLLCDNDIIRLRKRHIDFDYYSLAHNQDLALQFFRWKDWLITNVDQQLVKPGDLIVGTTNKSPFRQPMLWNWKRDPLSRDLEDHITTFTRQHCSEDMQRQQNSSTFCLRVDGDLTNRTLPGITRTYRCSLVSVDGSDDLTSVGSLCVKFYDDRFHRMEAPDPDSDNSPFWWRHWRTAEDALNCEVAAYESLQMAQGSLLPRFFGAHQVQCCLRDRRHR